MFDIIISFTKSTKQAKIGFCISFNDTYKTEDGSKQFLPALKPFCSLHRIPAYSVYSTMYCSEFNKKPCMVLREVIFLCS